MAKGVEGMQDFMKEDEGLCDFSKFNNCTNPPTRWIHDKRNIKWIHKDARVLEVVNRELKITRSAMSTAGALGIAGTVGGRMAYKGIKGGMKSAKVGSKTAGRLL